ncbi:Beta-hexosaminidase 3 [Linum grandiflorum]
MKPNKLRSLERMKMIQFVWVSLLMMIIGSASTTTTSTVGGRRRAEVNVWPMPKWSSSGEKTMYINPGNLKLIISSPSTNYSDSSGILKEAFSRMLGLLTLSHTLANIHSSPALPHLTAIRVLISSPNDKLQYGIDESYKLMVPSTDKSDIVHLEAGTVYGALHGLETFSQLCQFDFSTREIEIQMVPWIIVDQPRFYYRGLLIDTSRHYQPISMIKKIIDSMTYAKLNVLHWHIIDTQSFPLEIPSFPKLWNAAYSATERYTSSDAVEIVRQDTKLHHVYPLDQTKLHHVMYHLPLTLIGFFNSSASLCSYAKRRGVHVLAEIDVPGHALSWGIGYPSLWPSRHCQEPLDVSKEFTFRVIDGILSDFSKMFKFKFVHLGGDEVNTACWTSTPHIKNWLKEHKMNASQAYEYFVLRTQKIALSHGFEIINWEETFNNLKNKLNPETVIHNWLGGNVAPKVVGAGFRCIVSNQDKWYLDHLNGKWEDFYMNEPLANITNPQLHKLVIGGEVCVWGETVDMSDIQQTIWPRAAAAAERLWTSYDKIAKDPKQVTTRLTQFRCLLNERGVAAAPFVGVGRGSPFQPGSCFTVY